MSELTFIEDLAGMVTVPTESRTAKSVLDTEGVKVVLFAFAAGGELTEHSAPFPVMLQVQRGEIEVTAANRTVTLRPGGLVQFPARLPHSVRADREAVLQVTLLGHHSSQSVD